MVNQSDVIQLLKIKNSEGLTIRQNVQDDEFKQPINRHKIVSQQEKCTNNSYQRNSQNLAHSTSQKDQDFVHDQTESSNELKTLVRTNQEPIFDKNTNNLLLQIEKNLSRDIINIERQSDIFLGLFVEYCKQKVEDYKIKVNTNEGLIFKQDYPRRIIQKTIDNECFSINSKTEDWIDYINDPAKVIQNKYELLIKSTVSSLASEYEKFQALNELFQEFKQSLQNILQNFKACGMTQDTAHTDIFKIFSKTQPSIVVDNQFSDLINQVAMEFLLDLMIGQQIKVYIRSNIDFQLNKEYEFIPSLIKPTPLFIDFLKKLKKNRLSISRLLPFIEKLNFKISQKEETSQVQGIEDTLNKMKKMTVQDKKHFRTLINVYICKELCPGCRRICGIEEAHNNQHRCLYGHQIRAFGGVMLNNGDASVIRCEEIEQMSSISFNGRIMTWGKFKEYWENRKEGSWKFDDPITDSNQELFQKAWEICGQTICKQNGINFVKSNLSSQKHNSCKSYPVHYIFALDDSGSMCGKRWESLMNAFSSAIATIRKIPFSEKYIRISILIEGSNCSILQKNVSPSQVNLKIFARLGGNNFHDTFSKAYEIMNEFVNDSKIVFIFMTDGGDRYPSAPISMIKMLKMRNPGKIQYNGIEFQTSGSTMKMIGLELGGVNIISSNEDQLTQAYLEIINRK